MIERARAGARCAGDPPKFTNRIHRDDCAGVLAHLVDLGDRCDDAYIGVDDAPVEECEVLEWLAARLDAPPPRRVRGGEAASRGSGKRCSNCPASGERLSLSPSHLPRGIRRGARGRGRALLLNSRLAGEGVRYS